MYPSSGQRSMHISVAVYHLGFMLRKVCDLLAVYQVDLRFFINYVSWWSIPHINSHGGLRVAVYHLRVKHPPDS